jgi:hypothetical protein
LNVLNSHRRKRSTVAFSFIMLFLTSLSGRRLTAQTGGEGAITGTITDVSGALIPNAQVTATNPATGVAFTRPSSASGLYRISPVPVGTYTVTATASGFSSIKQEGIVINASQSFGLNLSLPNGTESQIVTVSDAPPALDTTNATLGGTISNKEYMDLPLLLAGNQQRDITQFSNLLPGAQPGARSSLVSGTASRVEEVYLDGIPITTISQIGDNRPIFNIVPSEAIDQIGATTSGQSADAQGAGSVNYTMASGANQIHGTIADFVRNTIFDTWGFTAPAATVQKLVGGKLVAVPAGKPGDHQNEFTATISGPISIPHLFSGHDKLFFFSAYDRTHGSTGPAYATTTIPTTLMRTGDFTELLSANGGPGYTLYDPTTLTCTAAGNCTRAAFKGLKNGVPTANVIPANLISPISQAMQAFLPAPTTSGIQGNYLGGNAEGVDNWLYSGRIDYNISPRHRLSFVVTGGDTHPIPFTASALLPLPYAASNYTETGGHWADAQDVFTIRPNLVNQLKYGFSNFGGPPSRNATQGVQQYEATTLGITFSGVPTTANSQATNQFPTSTFGGSNPVAGWGDGTPGTGKTTVDESYTVLDNLNWVKGNHSMVFGFQYQWLELNQSAQDGPTSGITLGWGINETAAVNGTTYSSGTGYSYASFLLGAVANSGVSVLPFSVLGGRFRPFSPYFQDNWKVNSKLTLNIGLRWDYLPTYNEVLDRFSFLNPNLTNAATGNLGALQFAGNRGGPGVSCECNSPAKNYLKNWGPRVGFAYALDSKTVVRGSYALVYSHGGGTGGAGGAYQGTVRLASRLRRPSLTGAQAQVLVRPSISTTAQASRLSVYPTQTSEVPATPSLPLTTPSAASQVLNTGNYVNSAGTYVTPGAYQLP